MKYTPEEIVRRMDAVMVSEDWALICERIDKEIKSMELQKSQLIKKREWEKSSHVNGRQEMAEYLKGLPLRVKRENLGIVQRVTDALNDLAS